MTTVAMQLQEPISISRSCLDKSIAAISKGLIYNSIENRGPPSPSFVLRSIPETVRNALPTGQQDDCAKPKSPKKTEKKPAQTSTVKNLTTPNEGESQDCVFQKKSSDVDNGEIIELMENRQQSVSREKKVVRRNMSIDVASLSHNAKDSDRSDRHFLLFYQENTARSTVRQ